MCQVLGYDPNGRVGDDAVELGWIEMHILYHHRTQGTGVEQVHIMGLVEGLRKRGHRVTIAGPPGTDPETDRRPASPNGGTGRRSLWGVVAERTPEVLFELIEIGYNLYSFCHLLFRFDKCDAVYERYALFQFGGMLAARLRNVPIILEVNDSALVERVRPLRLKKAARWLEGSIFKQADLLVTISTEFKRRLLFYSLAREKIRVLPNAIDPDLVDPRKHDGRAIRERYGLEDRVIIGCVGFFVPWHGMMFLLDVFSELAAQNGSLHLLLVGDGPEREAMEGKIRDLSLTDRVTLTGQVEHSSVPSFIKAFDVAVIPDVNEYCSPMKMFEYMGMARPIVAPASLPVQEVLQDGSNALLFRPGDGKGFYAALRRLTEDEALRRRLGRQVRQDVLDRHTWNRNAGVVAAELERASS
jgi:glycosyltransferase involved in cell wall biosynthesis